MNRNRWLAVAPLAVAALTLSFAAEERAMSVFMEIDGDPVYTVLPPDAIPAIRKPRHVTGEAAHGTMKPDEPVIGLLVEGGARAYSLWHLDAHEIVNDEAGGKKFAVTW